MEVRSAVLVDSQAGKRTRAPKITATKSVRPAPGKKAVEIVTTYNLIREA
jgi:hypothetical protein